MFPTSGASRRCGEHQLGLSCLPASGEPSFRRCRWHRELGKHRNSRGSDPPASGHAAMSVSVGGNGTTARYAVYSHRQRRNSHVLPAETPRQPVATPRDARAPQQPCQVPAVDGKLCAAGQCRHIGQPVRVARSKASVPSCWCVGYSVGIVGVVLPCPARACRRKGGLHNQNKRAVFL